jgi:HNH endonuclease
MTRHIHTEGSATPRNAMTKDHVEPRRYGGETTYWNMVAACCQCNQLRGELEAEAFYNITKKWFKRDPTLRERWFLISRTELTEFKIHCQTTHARQLRGRGRRHIEYAFRHYDFAIRGYLRYPLRA